MHSTHMPVHLQTLRVSMARARQSLLSKRGNASLWGGQNGGTVRFARNHVFGSFPWKDSLDGRSFGRLDDIVKHCRFGLAIAT
eukprot:scaffold92065_cov16-Prasinocladus_malaysianus.AAC.1